MVSIGSGNRIDLERLDHCGRNLRRHFRFGCFPYCGDRGSEYEHGHDRIWRSALANRLDDRTVSIVTMLARFDGEQKEHGLFAYLDGLWANFKEGLFISRMMSLRSSRIFRISVH